MDENIEDDKYNTRLGGEQTERNERMEDTAGRIYKTQLVEQKSQKVEKKTQQVEQKRQKLEKKTQQVEQKTQQVEKKTQQVEQKRQKVEQKTQKVEQKIQKVGVGGKGSSIQYLYLSGFPACLARLGLKQNNCKYNNVQVRLEGERESS